MLPAALGNSDSGPDLQGRLRREGLCNLRLLSVGVPGLRLADLRVGEAAKVTSLWQA